jgi:Lar family restriction alleviation protein
MTNEVSETLLPCPFCGGPGEFVADRSEPKTPDHVYVMCKQCDVYAPDGDDDSRAAKVATWNRRAPLPTETREQLIAEGRRQERDAVVAWLMREPGAVRWAKDLAWDIGRGEHVPAPTGERDGK